MAASLLGLGLFLGGGSAWAQSGASGSPTTMTLHFTKPAYQVPAGMARQPVTATQPSNSAPPQLDALFKVPPTPALTRSAATAAFAPAAVNPVGYQQPPMQGNAPAPYKAPGEDTSDVQIQLEPPGPKRLFRLESETRLQERMRQLARERPTPERIEFPEEKPISTGTFVARSFPAQGIAVEPHYVCYNRLYFEDLNSERYGWDLGFLQPFVSAGVFYWDLATLPYHMGTQPCRCFECSAGYCLPGDPVPYLIYPPELSITGTVFEAVTIGGLLAIFP